MGKVVRRHGIEGKEALNIPYLPRSSDLRVVEDADTSVL